MPVIRIQMWWEPPHPEALVLWELQLHSFCHTDYCIKIFPLIAASSSTNHELVTGVPWSLRILLPWPNHRWGLRDCCSIRTLKELPIETSKCITQIPYHEMFWSKFWFRQKLFQNLISRHLFPIFPYFFSQSHSLKNPSLTDHSPNSLILALSKFPFSLSL